MLKFTQLCEYKKPHWIMVTITVLWTMFWFITYRIKIGDFSCRSVIYPIIYPQIFIGRQPCVKAEWGRYVLMDKTIGPPPCFSLCSWSLLDVYFLQRGPWQRPRPQNSTFLGAVVPKPERASRLASRLHKTTGSERCCLSQPQMAWALVAPAGFGFGAPTPAPHGHGPASEPP
jgi:hypothetical protein